MWLALGAMVLAATAAGAATGAEPADEFRRMLEEGVPCPVPPPPAAAETPLREAVPRPIAPPEIEVIRGRARDLTTIRWRRLRARPVSEEIPIHVEEGTVGLVIRAESRDERHLISVELRNPRGELIACKTCPNAPVVGESRRGRGSTQMPSTDRPGWELTPGWYRFRVRAVLPGEEPLEEGGGDSVVDVTATLRGDTAVELQRYLNLNFVYLPGSSLSREIAQSAPEFAALLQKIDERMASVGIAVGEVTHYDLDRPEFSVIATWEEAGQMFLTSDEAGAPRAMNVYCVQGFEPPLNPAIGLSGGIPGPPYNGTLDSGIAVRTPPLFTCSNCLDAFGSLFAHEIGHYLGLYHTTEANLVREDPFSDTPRCHAPDLAICPDWNYVMFPVIHWENLVWSPGETAVVRSHPLLYAAPVIARRAEPADAPAFTSGPNPFRETVEIRLAGAGSGHAPMRALVYDVSGRRVRDLGLSARGFSWDGRSDRGRPVPGGVYFARLQGPDGVSTLRLVKRD